MQTHLPKKKVALYVRVSTHDQAEMFGEDLQLEKVMRYIELKDDLVLAGEEYIYKDLAVSGADEISERPELTRLFNDLKYSEEDPPFDLVLVYKIDRFARKLSVLLEIVETLESYNVKFASAIEAIDTGTAFGTAMLGILGVFAELERDMIRERTHDGKKQAILKGFWQNNRYGYFKNSEGRPEIYEPEAKVVRRIFELRLEGLSIAEICRQLGLEKHPIPTASRDKKRKLENKSKPLRGRSYHDPYKRNDNTVRKILRNPIYIGIVHYNKSTTVYDQKTKKTKSIKLPESDRLETGVVHEEIIDKKTFETVRKTLSKKGTYSKAKNEYILGGVLKCDACKEKRPYQKRISRTGKTSHKVSMYECQGKNHSKYTQEHKCKVLPISKEKLEKFVIDHIKAVFKNPKVFIEHIQKHDKIGNSKTGLKKQRQDLYNSKAKQMESLNNLTKLFINGDMTEKDFIESKGLIKQDIRSIDQQIMPLNKRIDEIVEYEKYEAGMGAIQTLVASSLETIFANPKALKKFISFMIDDIIIYSREKLPGEKFSGPKKAKQQVPCKIEINLKLPHEVLQQIRQFTRTTEDLLENYRRFTGSDGRYINKEDTDDEIEKSHRLLGVIKKLNRNMKNREKYPEKKRMEKVNKRIKNNPEAYEFLESLPKDE